MGGGRQAIFPTAFVKPLLQDLVPGLKDLLAQQRRQTIRNDRVRRLADLERERDRQTDRQTEKDRERERERKTDRRTDREAEREINR